MSRARSFIHEYTIHLEIKASSLMCDIQVGDQFHVSFQFLHLHLWRSTVGTRFGTNFLHHVLVDNWFKT